MLEQGLIQIYTSDSDRFNFAPLGLALRAAGQKFRSRITCFFRHELMDGLPLAAEIFKPYIQMDVPARHLDAGNEETLKTVLAEAFRTASEGCRKGDFDLVILNGVLTALGRGLIPPEDVLALMEDKPDRVELVLSGRGAPREILEKADLVTEMAVSGPHDIPRTEPGPKRPVPWT